ncbi:MAG: PAS domain-containing protein [Cyclobacteriaceae bacterium]|nr:PAS domain-containing protein [Cyclobacteriaceae bacterium]MDX5466339.1 PAS domain-containing protein [Cyclobacteriaceae bacterium]
MENPQPIHAAQDSFQKSLLEELTKSGTWELHLEENRLYWSSGIFKMLGYAPNEFEVTFETGIEVIHPNDRQRALDHMKEVLNDAKEYRITKKLIKKDGTLIKVLSRAIWIHHPETGEKILSGAFQDITQFSETQAKLDDEQVKNKSLIENLDGIFWEADANTFDFTFISSQVEKITGFSVDEWLSEPQFWKNHIHPEDRENAVNFCHLETQKLEDHEFDYRFITKTGGTIWLNDRVKVISKNGKPFKLQGLMVDITREKMVKQALEEEISLNNSLIQKLPGVLFLFDLEGNILLWNPYVENISGYSKEEVASMEPVDFFRPEDKPLILKEIERVANGENRKLSVEVLAKDSRLIPIQYSGSLVMYKGKPCILGIGQDVSELLENKRLAEENLERFVLVTKATNEAIWDYDLRKQTLYCGEGFEKLFEYSPEEISLDLLLDLIHPEDREGIQARLMGLMTPTSSQINWVEECRFRKKSGTYTEVLIKGFLIRNESGYITRAVGSIQDISVQKEFERSLKSLNEHLEKNIRELAFSNQELQRFAFVASHDLQEPLRMISSFMGLLEKKYGSQLDEKALSYIDFASKGAKQMQKIILDLLEHSKVGSTEEPKTWVEVENVIQEISLYLKKQIHEKRAKIELSNLPTISTYKAVLFQIFLNLISNSIKYSSFQKFPEIRISAIELDEFWKFSVSDNGIGIAPENFDKIFVIFERLHSKEKYEGTGIGLAIVKKAVEYLGGEITVSSELGLGSTFTFTIKK